MRSGPFAAVVVLFLAGCVAPVEPLPADETGMVLPPVDLLQSVMRIDFPQDQPSALILLNITEEMWARPTFWVPTAFATVRPWPEPVPAPHWVLCPSLRFEGLPEDAKLTVLPFWVRDGALVPAKEQMYGYGYGNGEGECAGARAWNGRHASIAADQPFAGTMALIVAGTPNVMTFPRPATESFPGFTLEVGVAREPCAEDEAAWCPPESVVAAEPQLRGGPVLRAQFTGGIPSYSAIVPFFPPDACEECGFEIEDGRTRLGDVTAGTVTAQRTGHPGRGVTFTGAGLWFDLQPGSNRVSVDLTVDGETLQHSCEDTSRTGNVGIYTVAAHREAPAYLATFEIVGAKTFAVEMEEIPLDLEAAGLSLEPTVIGAFSGLLWGSTGAGNLC